MLSGLMVDLTSVKQVVRAMLSVQHSTVLAMLSVQHSAVFSNSEWRKSNLRNEKLLNLPTYLATCFH